MPGQRRSCQTLGARAPLQPARSLHTPSGGGRGSNSLWAGCLQGGGGQTAVGGTSLRNGVQLVRLFAEFGQRFAKLLKRQAARGNSYTEAV